MYSSKYISIYALSPKSCFKVSSAAGKPRYIPLRPSRPYQPRACCFFIFHFELTPFSDGQISKVSARSTVFNWENYEYCLEQHVVPITKIHNKFNPLIQMLSSYIPSGTLWLVVLGSAKQCWKPSSSVDDRCLVSMFYVCLHLCA